MSCLLLNYDGLRREKRTLGDTPGSVTNYGYSRNDNLVTDIDQATIGNYDYAYDANKNKTEEVISGPLSPYGFGNNTATTYDDEDRLIGWNRDDNNKSQSWNLSPVGDWNQFVELGTTPTSETRTHTAAHETATISGVGTPVHDAKGNITTNPFHGTQNYAWDFDNRMKSVTTGANTHSYTYDALGRRVSKAVMTGGGTGSQATVTTIYVCSGQQVAAEYVASQPATNPLRKYVYASYIDEPILLIDRTSTGAIAAGTDELFYYHCNSLYSIQALTNQSGVVQERYAYDAYGNISIFGPDLGGNLGAAIPAPSLGNMYTYTGRRLDTETTLYYYRARYYDSQLGRFIGRDPIDKTEDLNRYQYVLSSPLKYLDWTGNEPNTPQDAATEVELAIEDSCSDDEKAAIQAAHSLALDRLARNPNCFARMRHASEECRSELHACITEALNRMTIKCAYIGQGKCHLDAKGVTESNCSKLKEDGARGEIRADPPPREPSHECDPCNHPNPYANNCRLCDDQGVYGPITTWLCRSQRGPRIVLDPALLAELLVHEASHNCVGGHDTTSAGGPGTFDICRRPDSGAIEETFKSCE